MYSTKPYQKYHKFYYDETDAFTYSLVNRYSAYEICSIDINFLLYQLHILTTKASPLVFCGKVNIKGILNIGYIPSCSRSIV